MCPPPWLPGTRLEPDVPYPGEVSRRQFDSRGVTVTELTVDPYGSGDTVLVLIPEGVADGQPVTLMLVAHGHGGSEQTMYGGLSEIRYGGIDRGWILASAYASGNAWSNDAALNDYTRVWQWISDTWQVDDVLLHGVSMGGLTMANLYYRDIIPEVRAMAGVDSAVNLRAAYDGNYGAAIRAAYGIASDGSDYAAKTTWHNPCLLPAAGWHGKNLLLTGSDADTAIAKSQHLDVLVDAMGPYPTLTTYTGTGTHVAVENYFHAETLAFYDAALAGGLQPTPLPEWPAPEPLPAGLVEVEMFTIINGDPVRLTAW